MGYLLKDNGNHHPSPNRRKQRTEILKIHRNMIRISIASLTCLTYLLVCSDQETFVPAGWSITIQKIFAAIMILMVLSIIVNEMYAAIHKNEM